MYIRIILITFFLFLGIGNCRRGPIDYESQTQINRMEVTKFDEQGNPLNLDVEISYINCPGDQIEIIRGDKDFAKCILKNHKKGDLVNTKINWRWDNLGFYEWEVQKVGECAREWDLEDEGSYEMIEECEEYLEYKVNVGFRCKRIATNELISKCPWFNRK